MKNQMNVIATPVPAVQMLSIVSGQKSSVKQLVDQLSLFAAFDSDPMYLITESFPMYGERSYQLKGLRGCIEDVGLTAFCDTEEKMYEDNTRVLMCIPTDSATVTQGWDEKWFAVMKFKDGYIRIERVATGVTH